MKDSRNPTAAIIGAGPFGVSIAAHMLAAGTDIRIFGEPMNRWRFQMPEGMFLKSEGRASSLSEPTGRYTLARFCADEGLPYDDRSIPVSLDTFTRYALAFQRHLVPGLERTMVTEVRKSAIGFDLRLADGSKLHTRKVIVATGLDHAAYVPRVLRGLSPELASHSCEHASLSRFRGKDVTVIGGGQSALETAALLSEQGATVRVIVRKAVVAWNNPPRLGHRPLYRRLRYPVSNLGEGLQLWLYSNAPRVFSHFPRHIRLAKVRSLLDAAGGWWLRSRVENAVTLLTGCSVVGAQASGSGVDLTVTGVNQKQSIIRTDHVIAATGYRYKADQLPFLSGELKKSLRTEDGRPIVSSHFESTVPGLYFAGMASASTFGPVMRFIAGVGYTARKVAGHIASLSPHDVKSSSPAVATSAAFSQRSR